MVIVSDSTGKELRALVFDSYDIEVGDDKNDFEVKILIPDWETIPDGARIYIPDTEYGGMYRTTEVDTKQGYIAVGGSTWRGMLKQKIIQPPAGQDYAAYSGDINTIIGSMVTDAFGGLFTGASPYGVTLSGQFNRYVTLYDGLTAMLKRAKCKLNIKYDQIQKKVVVSASPIVDFSNSIEFSDDLRANYYVRMDGSGVNHLICLGSGQLKDRTVVNLYVDMDGNISQTQTFFGADEIASVYDYAGAAEAQLIQSGTQQLRTLRSINKFTVDIEGGGNAIEVGDIVGGRDYVSGITMKAPITGKIVKWYEGAETTEYTISDNVEVRR